MFTIRVIQIRNLSCEQNVHLYLMEYDRCDNCPLPIPNTDSKDIPRDSYHYLFDDTHVTYDIVWSARSL